MTKKAKRTALIQRTQQIADLQRENEQLKARLAECEKRGGALRPGRQPSTVSAASSVDAFTICDSHLTVTDVDEAALRYFGQGLRKEDVIGKSLADLIADKERCARYLKVVETGDRFFAEETLVLPDIGEVDVITRAFRAGDGLGILTSDVTAQKRMEDESKRSQELLRAFMDSATDAFTVYDSHLTLIDVNETALRYLGPGVRREDVIGKKLADFVPDKKVLDSLIKVMETGESLTAEETMALPAAGEFTVITRSFRVGDGLGVVTTDITPRKRIENELRQRQELLRTFMDSAADSFTIYDSHLNLLDVNETALRYLGPGVRREDVVGKNLADFITDRERHAPYLKVMATGEPLVTEETFVLPTVGEFSIVTRTFKVGDGIGIVTSDVTARKRMEKELRQSEQRYRLLAENASDVIWTTDIDLKITYMSASASRLLGYAMEEVMTLTVGDLLTPESADLGVKAFREQLALEAREGVSPQREWTVELQMRRRDGSTVWVEERVNFIRDAGGRITGLMGIAREIADRKKVEESLKASEEKYRRLFESTRTAIEVVSLETGLVVLANEATARMFGFASAADLVGVDSMQYLRPEDVGWVSSRMAQAVGQDWQEIAELQVRTNDGRWIWVSGMTIATEYQGKPALLVSMLDITRLKQTEETLRASEERSRLLLENANEGIAVVQDGVVRFANPKLAEQSGYSVSELMSKPFAELIHPDDLPKVVEYYSRRVKGEEFSHVYQVRFIHKTGDAKWGEVNAVSIHWEGKPAVLGMITDISERLAAQQALEESEQKNRLLVDGANEAIGVVQDGVLKFVNRRFAEYVGYSAQELANRSFADFIHPDDRHRVADYYFKRISDQEAPPTYQFKWIDREAAAHWGEASVAVLSWEGRPAALCMLSDITKRRHAEEALKKSESLLRDTQELAGVGGWEYEVETRKASWTDQTYRIHELPVDPTLDHVAVSLKCYLPEDRPVIEQALRECIDEGVPYDLEFPFVTFAGNRRWVRTTGRAVVEGDKIVRVLGNIVDITERRKAEESLRASEERNRLLVDNANEGIAVVQDGLVKFINPKFTRDTGYTAEEIVNRSFADFIHPDDRGILADRYVRRLKGEELPSLYQFRYVRKSGETRWAELNAASFEWEGRPAILAMVGDVTERKLAEESLRASEEKYRGIFDESVVAIYIFDDKKHFIDSNQAGLDLLGYSREELLSMSIPDVDADPVVVLPAYSEVLSSGRLINYEHRLRRKDGAIITVLNNSRPLTDADGRVIGMQSTLADISDRKRAAAALEESERRYRLLAENSRDIIWTADADLRITYASPSTTRVLGYSTEDIVGHSFEKLVTPASLAIVSRAHDDDLTKEARAAGAFAGSAMDVEMMRKDGSTVWMEVAVNPIRDAEGCIAGYQGACRDITERRRTQEVLKESEAAYRVIFDQSPNAMTLSNIMGEYVDVNRRHLEEQSLSRAEILGRTALEIGTIDAEQSDAMAKEFERLGGKLDQYEARVWAPAKGEWHDVLISAGLIPVRGESMILTVVNNITDRKLAEARLQKSEERFRLITENMLDAVSLLDGKGIIQYASPSHRRILGYRSEDLVGKSVFELLCPEDMDSVMASLDGILEKREARYQYRFRHADGHYVWGDASARILLDDGGNVSGFVIASRDITERKKAEEALRRSEKRYRLVFENSPVSIWEEDFSRVKVLLDDLKKQGVTDIEAYFGQHPETVQQCAEMAMIVDVNRATLALHGAASKEELLAGLVSTFTPESFDTFRQELVCLWNGGTAMTSDAVVKTLAGDFRYVTLSISVAPGFEDTLSKVLVTLTDITERKRAEEALQKNEAMLASLLEATPAGVGLLNNRVLLKVNKSLSRITGYSEQEMLGQTSRMLYPDEEEYLRIGRELYGQMEREGLGRVEARLRHKDGALIHVILCLSPFDPQDPEAGVCATVLDITERKQAEEALRESEEKYRGLFDSSRDAIMTIEPPSWRFTSGNPATLEVFGAKDEEEFISYTPWELSPDRQPDGGASVEKAKEMIETAVREGSCSFDWTHQRLDGEEFPASVLLSRMQSAGKVLLQATIRDISERKRAEEALRESEARFRRLSEATEEGIAIHDRGTIVEANEALSRMFGYPLSELVGMNAEELATPESWQLILKHMATGDEEPYEGVGVRKDGSTFWCSLVGKAYQYKGKMLRLGAFRDITKRKRAEEELLREEKRFRAIAENSSDVIVMVNPDGTVAYESPAIQHVLGFPPEERVGVSVFSLIHPDDLRLVTGPFQELMRNPQAHVQRAEIRLRHKDGSWRIVEASGSGVVKGSTVEAVVITLHDVTQRRKAEQALHERLKELQCIAGISRLAEKPEMPVEDFVREAVSLLPGAWQYPDICCARITLDSKKYQTADFRKTKWSQSADIRVDEKRFGAVTVCYLKERPAADEGPFLKEERDLINTIADFMGHVIQHRQMEGELRASEENYRQLFEAESDAIFLIDNETGHVLQSNQAAAALYGYSRDELLAMRNVDLSAEPDQSEAVARETPVYADRVVTIPLRWHRKRDGVRFPVEITGRFFMREGRSVHVAAIRDITGRKQMEETIQRQRDLAHDLSSVSELQQGLRICLEAAIKSAGMDCGGVYLVDKATGGLRLMIHAGLSSEFVESVSYYAPGSPGAKVVFGGNPVYARHLTLGVPLDEEREREGLKAIAIIPFFYEGEVLGCVHVASHTLDEVPESARGPLVTISHEAGGAVARLMAREELRASEERYRLLAENATDVIWTMDMELRYTYVSPSAVRLTGFSAEETMVQSLDEVMTPGSYDAVSRILAEELVVEEGGSGDPRRSRMLEAELRCKETSTVWVEIQAAFLRDAAGKAVGILGVSRNITERKRAEEEIQRAHAELEARVEQRTAELKEANMKLLREVRQRRQAQERLQESESRYRELVESANSIILELDTKGKITFFNRFAQDFFLFSESDIVGRHVVGTIAPAVDSEGKDRKEMTRDLIKHPEQYLVIENEGVRRNGERVWISWTNKGLYDAKGRLRNVLCIGMDRTEQKRVAEMLAQQAKEKAAVDERQRLARDLHDAVTQTLFSASLIAEALPQLWKKDREEGVRRLEELRRLTRGALAEMRMLLLELRPAALAEVGLADLLHQLAEATTAQSRIEVAFAPRGTCSAPADVQVALYRVAQEAINNVVKHSGATEAEIILTCREGSADLNVSDNGSGFDPKTVLPKSLGLRIMQERAEAIGATLKIEGRPGRGARIRALVKW